MSSENIESSPNNKSKSPNKSGNPSFWRRKSTGYLGAGLIGAGLITGGLINGASAEDKNPEPGDGDKNPPATEAYVSPTPTIDSEVIIPSTDSTETEAPNPEVINVEVLKQTLTVEQMDAMEPIDVVALPYADRLAYAIAKVGSAFPTSTVENDKWNKPEGIPGYFWQSSGAYSMSHPDANTRAILASVDDYYTTLLDGSINPNLLSAMDNAVSAGGEGTGSTTLESYIDSGDIQKGYDRDGNAIEFRNITHQRGYSNSDGKDPIQTTQTIRVEVQLLDGSTVVWYPKGYTVDGQQSPDSNYPY